MQDSETSFRLVDWLISAVGGTLSWLGVSTLKRVAKLEQDKQDIAQARLERAELKGDIHDLGMRMDTQHASLGAKIDSTAQEMRTRLDALINSQR